MLITAVFGVVVLWFMVTVPDGGVVSNPVKEICWFFNSAISTDMLLLLVAVSLDRVTVCALSVLVRMLLMSTVMVVLLFSLVMVASNVVPLTIALMLLMLSGLNSSVLSTVRVRFLPLCVKD